MWKRSVVERNTAGDERSAVEGLQLRYIHAQHQRRIVMLDLAYGATKHFQHMNRILRIAKRKIYVVLACIFNVGCAKIPRKAILS